ncbi:hypothetical protein [Pasteurella multocida]|uniref:hypothetical protein n=1 Tax=Pasteurella multocida TaxID=747 RepID=UPI0029301AC8|nr:hypothetical protein [Pasteurella multocida]WNY75951.1 hypothetical protein H2513_08715 [Pasteurella multocida]
MINEKVRMTVKIEMERYQFEQLEISSKTEVLGGKIVRLDLEGCVFDEVDGYRNLFNQVDSSLMGIVFENLKDKDFVGELQLAIKQAITPIARDKRKAMLGGLK